MAQQANYRKSGFRNAWNNIRYEGAFPEASAPAGVTLADARDVPFDRLEQLEAAAGIGFVENLAGFAGYMIAADGIATMTSSFARYTRP